MESFLLMQTLESAISKAVIICRQYALHLISIAEQLGSRFLSTRGYFI